MQAHIYLKSYKHVLKRLNIGFDNSLVRYGEFSERGGYGATESLLAIEAPPAAILFLWWFQQSLKMVSGMKLAPNFQ